VSELTVRDLRELYLLREVDRIRVKGKSQPVGVFEVLDHFGEGTPARDPSALEAFRSGLDEYRSRNWRQAQGAFEETLRRNPHDGLSRLYIERSAYFAAHPPPEDWDGVWVMKEK
jgi:adenylate cyclase